MRIVLNDKRAAVLVVLAELEQQGVVAWTQSGDVVRFHLTVKGQELVPERPATEMLSTLDDAADMFYDLVSAKALDEAAVRGEPVTREIVRSAMDSLGLGEDTGGA